MTAPANTLPIQDDALSTVPQDEPESRPGGLPLYVWVILAVGDRDSRWAFLG